MACPPRALSAKALFSGPLPLFRMESPKPPATR